MFLYKPEDMPTEGMRSLAELCGVDFTIKFIDLFGGQTITFPTKSETAVYAQIKAAFPNEVKKVCEYFAGETLHIPVRSSMLKFRIGDLYCGDRESLNKIIREYCVTESHVYRLLKKKRLGGK